MFGWFHDSHARREASAVSAGEETKSVPETMTLPPSSFGPSSVSWTSVWTGSASGSE
jgi:hypothetical protein